MIIDLKAPGQFEDRIDTNDIALIQRFDCSVYMKRVFHKPFTTYKENKIDFPTIEDRDDFYNTLENILKTGKTSSKVMIMELPIKSLDKEIRKDQVCDYVVAGLIHDFTYNFYNYKEINNKASDESLIKEKWNLLTSKEKEYCNACMKKEKTFHPEIQQSIVDQFRKYEKTLKQGAIND